MLVSSDHRAPRKYGKLRPSRTYKFRRLFLYSGSLIFSFYRFAQNFYCCANKFINTSRKHSFVRRLYLSTVSRKYLIGLTCQQTTVSRICAKIKLTLLYSFFLWKKARSQLSVLTRSCWIVWCRYDLSPNPYTRGLLPQSYFVLQVFSTSKIFLLNYRCEYRQEFDQHPRSDISRLACIRYQNRNSCDQSVNIMDLQEFYTHEILP